MEPQTHRQVHPSLTLQADIELAQGLDYAQSSSHRPLRVILMCQGVPEVDQHTTVFIHGQTLTVNELLLQVCQDVIVELELPFEGAIGHASTALEQGNGLIQQLLKSHA